MSPTQDRYVVRATDSPVTVTATDETVVVSALDEVVTVVQVLDQPVSVAVVDEVVEIVIADVGPQGIPGPPGADGARDVLVDGVPGTLNFTPNGDGTYGLEVTV